MTWVCIKDDACKAFDSSCSTLNNFSKQKETCLHPIFSCIMYCEYGFRDKIDNPPKLGMDTLQYCRPNP